MMDELEALLKNAEQVEKVSLNLELPIQHSKTGTYPEVVEI